MGGGRTRNLILAGLLAAGLGAAGSGAFWAWAAGQVATAIASWSDAQRARGWDVAYAGPELGGYPLAVTARLDSPAVGSPHGWRWAGERILGRANVWAPLTLDLELPRAQTLSAEVRGQIRDLALASAGGRGRLVFRGNGEIAAAEVEFLDLNATSDSGWRLSAARLHLSLSGAPASAAGEARVLLNGEASDITLPDTLDSPFGQTLRRLALQAAVFGRVPAGDPAAGLAAWRDQGGRIEVEGFTLRYGPLDLLAQGTVRLDGALRPDGELEARIGGLNEALSTLSAAGLIDRNAAFALKLSALALARREAGTGRPVVDLPITLRDGWAYLGPLALFKLGPVI